MIIDEFILHAHMHSEANVSSNSIPNQLNNERWFFGIFSLDSLSIELTHPNRQPFRLFLYRIRIVCKAFRICAREEAFGCICKPTSASCGTRWKCVCVTRTEANINNNCGVAQSRKKKLSFVSYARRNEFEYSQWSLLLWSDKCWQLLCSFKCQTNDAQCAFTHDVMEW